MSIVQLNPRLDRRSILGRLGVAGPMVASGAAVASPTHPDAELLQAEQDWRAAYRAWITLCRADAEDVDTHPLWAKQQQLVGAIVALPARTPAGIAVKLRMAFLQGNNDLEVEEFLVHGGSRPDYLLDDDERHLVWQAIEALDAMPGGRA